MLRLDKAEAKINTLYPDRIAEALMAAIISRVQEKHPQASVIGVYYNTQHETMLITFEYSNELGRAGLSVEGGKTINYLKDIFYNNKANYITIYGPELNSYLHLFEN